MDLDSIFCSQFHQEKLSGFNPHHHFADACWLSPPSIKISFSLKVTFRNFPPIKTPLSFGIPIKKSYYCLKTQKNPFLRSFINLASATFFNINKSWLNKHFKRFLFSFPFVHCIKRSFLNTWMETKTFQSYVKYWVYKANIPFLFVIAQPFGRLSPNFSQALRFLVVYTVLRIPV